MGGVGDQLGEVLLENEGVDGRQDADCALEASRHQGDEEVEVGGESALPPAGNGDEGVDAGQSSPPSSHEVQAGFAFKDEVDVVEELVDQGDSE